MLIASIALMMAAVSAFEMSTSFARLHMQHPRRQSSSNYYNFTKELDTCILVFFMGEGDKSS
jgi:hypothetical protein